MATYRFGRLTQNQALSFDPVADTLLFDIVGLDAAEGSLRRLGTDLLVSYHGTTVRLLDLDWGEVSGSHFRFANGSRLRAGDDDPATTVDTGPDVLNGTVLGDYLLGLEGNDRLDGRAGADHLVGGPGNDIYVVDDPGDRVVESPGEGTDTVLSSIDLILPVQVERLTLIGSGDLSGVGNALANVLAGNDGDNTLSGADGDDNLKGGPGDDVLSGGAGRDVLNGGDGDDVLGGDAGNDVLAGGAGDDVASGGAGGDTLSGGTGQDALDGGAGNDNLDGGAGSDVLAGGAGNDRYTVNTADDTVLEFSGQGTDTVRSSTHYSLPANVEQLVLTGRGNLQGWGNALGNVLVGNAGDNLLDGLGGADTLQGAGGNDRLAVWDLSFNAVNGGAGDDTLVLAGLQLTLDLAQFGGKLQNLEAVDLHQGGNTLVLTPATLGGLASGGIFKVTGDTSDAVYAGLGWTRGADAMANGFIYHTYTHGTANLWLDAGLGTALAFDTAIPLSRLRGPAGFRLDGAAASDASGTSVSAAGDVNGDGYGDLIIGAPGADHPSSGTDSGASYVVFGQGDRLTTTVALSSLDGDHGFRLDGAGAFDATGSSVSAAGDVNGDGYADLIIGAHSAASDGVVTGASYVVFGRPAGFAAALDLSSLDGSDGFRLDGAAEGDLSGISVSGAGDVNGDGYDDLIVGAPYADPQGLHDAGSGYVVFGKAAGFQSSVQLSSLDGVTGFRLDGPAEGHDLGRSVSAAGDVNGDGYADLIVGADRAAPHGAWSGSSYVVFGKGGEIDAAVDLSKLNGSDGFRLDGAALFDESGNAVSAAGDINGDGYGDLVVGARGTDSGSSYVVFGQAGAFDAVVALSDLDGSTGFRLDGAEPDGGLGRSVSGVGDVNGDGFDDLIVGAPYADPQAGPSSGSTYVVLGKADGFAAVLDVAALDGANGFRLDGAAEDDHSGGSVSAAGDVNGDGFADLIIGANQADPHGGNSGSSYVVFGGDFTGAVTKLGSAGNENLSGTAAAERFVGGQGDDLLIGGGGADVLLGGEGDDRLTVASLDFQRIDGGSGFDTLALAGTGFKLDLDLAAFRNRLSGTERIDLTGNGDNTLTLPKRDVLNLSDTSNTLRVDGDAGDHYDFSDGGWKQGEDVTLVGVLYHRFDKGAATLLLDAALTET